MKKIQYSAGLKAVAILFQEVFSVVLVICMVLVSVLFNRSMLELGDLKNKSFLETKYYESLFQDSVMELLNFSKLKEAFETDAVYDPERVVDIHAYANGIDSGGGNVVLPKEMVFGYYLQDMEDWSKEYVLQNSRVDTGFYISEDGSMHQHQTVLIEESSVQDSEESIQKLGDLALTIQEVIVGEVQHYYGGYYELSKNISAPSTTLADSISNEDFAVESVAKQATDSIDSTDSQENQTKLLEESIQKVVDGKLFELEGEALRVLLEDLELTTLSSSENGTVVQEKYLPTGQKGIMDSFLSGDISLVEMQQSFQNLEYTLQNIGDQISAYKRCVNKYEKNDTNLSYWIFKEEQMVPYTNIKEADSKEDLLTYGKRQGGYFYYNEKEIRLATNIGGMEETYYDKLEKGHQGKNRVIMIAVNTAFPYEDSLYQAREEYNQVQPWIMVSLVSFVISIFGCFLCLIYLSMSAGRSNTDDEIHLCWFDKIKTEFMLFGFLALCVGIVYLCSSIVSRFGMDEMAGLMIMAGGLTFTATGAFLVLYLSLVRRVKASAMWSGSFLYWVCKGIQKVFQNRKPATKILVLFSIHVWVTILLAGWVYWDQLLWEPVILFLMLTAFELVVFLREGIQRNIIMEGIKRIAAGDLEYEIETLKLKGDNKSLGEAVNTIGEGLYHAVDDNTKSERLKADLITNVSHDIKTPLTSIINYVDLMKREKIPNERVQGYISILDEKSQRLKQLTEDLVEASKVSSGNVTLQMDKINFVELVYQTAGEFNEKFESRGLTAITKLPKEPVIIMADGRRIWRVIENLYNNVAKYAMVNTRVYVDMEVTPLTASFSIKNISEQALNIEASELTERFIRGDVSRSTEGSGLGLSIAKNLTELMGGTFDIYLDGDLFKVSILFPRFAAEEMEALI